MSDAPPAGKGLQPPGPARHRHGLLAVALGLAVLAATAGCTGPVRSDGVYASKAAATAGAAGSAVETAQLAVQEAAAGKLFGRSLAQALAEAASDASDVQATFDAIQPPDGRSSCSEASWTASSPQPRPPWPTCGSPPAGRHRRRPAQAGRATTEAGRGAPAVRRGPPVRKLLEIALGILTAIGGFVDIGDLVASTETGARFGLGLAWVLVVGVLGIIIYAEMAGRVASLSGRAVFDLVRERLGAGVGLLNLAASFFITLLTLAAEIGGVALSLQLATSVNYLLFVPVIGFLVWVVCWRVRFEVMDNTVGLLGLALIVVAVAVWRAHPDWGAMLHSAAHPVVPRTESHAAYWYFAIALLGSAMTPYEVFFFSSGAVEQRWTRSDLLVNRLNVYIGFPLGGLLALALMVVAALVLEPRGIDPSHLSQAALPTSLVLGKLGLALALVGFFACTSGAALETALSCGYSLAQYFGWPWGKLLQPAQAPRFQLVVLVSIAIGAGLVLTTLDPIKLTEYAIVLSAAALPLTYLPLLIVANDPAYLGDKVNSRLSNAIASLLLVVLLVASVVTIPLMILSKAGGG